MTGRRALWFFLIPASAAVFLASAAKLRLFLDVPIVNLRPERTIIIPPRTTPAEVADILEREGIIPGGWLFSFWTRLLGLQKHIRYGEYTFGGPQTIKSIIDTLISGRTTLHHLTIPEGYSLEQIAEEIEAEGLGQAQEILRAAHDPLFVKKMGVSGLSLEGFCFPETYSFPRDWPARRILQAMVSRFWEVFDQEMLMRAQEIELTVFQVVTLASIIERESARSDELPVISAVFHNRLRKDIPLAADPVLIYGIKNFDGNIRKRDLMQKGPYNVYLKTGLPPSPICNPGLPAIRAALYPAGVDFLYFVSKNDGSHYFSKSLTDHNQAVEKYQRGRN